LGREKELGRAMKIKRRDKVRSPLGSCPECLEQINGEQFIKTATEKKLIGPCPHCGEMLRYYIINPHVFVKAKSKEKS